MRFAYNKGCALLGAARAYDVSLSSAATSLDIELVDFDWNCCGTSLTESVNPPEATALCAANIKAAADLEIPMLLPCSGCYKQHSLAQNKLTGTFLKTAERAGITLPECPIELYSPVHLFSEPLVLEKIARASKTDLSHLRVACYYGCQLNKPHSISRCPDPQNPNNMEAIFAAAGIQSVDWGYKTECCGASLNLPRPDIIEKRVSQIITSATRAGANIIVSCCPICQTNLETRQTGHNFPALYFTEVLSEALITGSYSTTRHLHITSPSEDFFSPSFGNGEAQGPATKATALTEDPFIYVNNDEPCCPKVFDSARTVAFVAGHDYTQSSSTDAKETQSLHGSLVHTARDLIESNPGIEVFFLADRMTQQYFTREELCGFERLHLIECTVGKILRQSGKLVLRCCDTATGRPMELSVDMACLIEQQPSNPDIPVSAETEEAPASTDNQGVPVSTENQEQTNLPAEVQPKEYSQSTMQPEKDSESKAQRWN